MRRLLPLFRLLIPYRKRIALALVAIVLSAAMVLVIGQGLKVVIDEGFSRGQERLLDATLATLVAMIAALGALTWIRVYNVYWIGARFTADLRQRVYDHLLTLSPGFYEAARTGEVSSRVTNDVTLIEAVMGGTLLYALRMAITLVGCAAMLVVTSVKLSVLALASMPVVLLPIGLLGLRVRRLSRAVQDRVADVSSQVDETLHEIRTVQAFAHEDLAAATFGERVEEVFRAAVQRSGYLALLIATVIVLAFGAVALLLWVGAHDVFVGRLTAGSLTAFIFYAVIVANATFVLSEVYGEFQRAAGASERLLEILDTESRIRAPAHPVTLPPPRGRVAFEEVTFFYPSRPATPALDHFSLTVEPGEVVALVGPSGAGKTTVFQLLLRFYDPATGRVTIDGVDARAADPRELRRRVAVVAQDPVIFASSVLENVRYGRPQSSDEEVRQALSLASALDFVDKLPEGIRTQLGERGVKLSGGQRQRIAIARAMLADRAVLLLDEATSSLDAESEKAVQLGLERLMQGRTTLVIAHRLATVKSCDRIIVIDHGRVVATGTHASLANESGLYARLAALQFASAAS
ncbi:MAG TPA: ABC transporter transmembrane domain-containing protein [Usitatibacter sp.]|nr:ABC transporter transmembrane domain-containing protein [Usitatibacter sp.]